MSTNSQTYSDAELLADLREINRGLERLEAKVDEDLEAQRSMSHRLDQLFQHAVGLRDNLVAFKRTIANRS